MYKTGFLSLLIAQNSIWYDCAVVTNNFLRRDCDDQHPVIVLYGKYRRSISVDLTSSFSDFMRVIRLRFGIPNNEELHAWVETWCWEDKKDESTTETIVPNDFIISYQRQHVPPTADTSGLRDIFEINTVDNRESLTACHIKHGSYVFIEQGDNAFLTFCRSTAVFPSFESVSFLPGPRCSLLSTTYDPSSYSNCIRLSFSFYDEAEIETGMKILYEVYKEYRYLHGGHR